jgi:hypothetical protein
MRRFLLYLFLAAASRADVVTVYQNFSEDPNAGLGSYPYACSDSNCSNLSAYGIEWWQSYYYGSTYGNRQLGAQEAMSFTVGGTQDLYLHEVQLAMYKWPDGTPWFNGNVMTTNHDNLTVEIVTDAGGAPSNNVLEVLSVNPSITEDDTSFLNLYSSNHTLLRAGQTYWIEALPTTFDMTDTSQDAAFGWMENQEGAQWKYTINQWNISYNNWNGGWQGFFSQSSSFTAPALNVFAITSIPEPGTLVVVGLAFIGLSRVRRRR